MLFSNYVSIFRLKMLQKYAQQAPRGADTESVVNDSDDDHQEYQPIFIEVNNNDDPDEDDTHKDDEKNPVISCAGLSSHELEFLQKPPYSANPFRCDVCGKKGNGELYHCEPCQFDAHKRCTEIEEEVEIT